MDQAIEGRELITLNGLGVFVRGTFHKPSGSSRSSFGVSTPKLVGLVFLNSLSLPRTATGDSAVFWAESFANYGYPSFRLDLPGLGDTTGNIPTDLLGFINAGGYASIAEAKMKELVERFNLSGVVLVGHCAGTVSAIYAAAACMGKECKGLVLLDPYFDVPQAIRPRVRRGLSNWALRSSLGGIVSNIYDRIRKIGLIFRGSAPPQNANLALLSRWREVASTGLPILLFKSPGRKTQGTKPRAGEFDYLAHVLKIAGRKSQVAVELLEGTDHTFANRTGRAAVRRHIELWLSKYLPLPEKFSAPASQSQTDHTNNHDTSRLSCLQQ
jgi:alpha-beta hydrolase superfamily lysophospholipase